MKAPEKFRALLVGVWNYQRDSGFDDLLGPPNDVVGMQHALGGPATGLFTVSTLRNASAYDLRFQVQRFLKASAEENVLIYYSGHADIGSSGHLFLTSSQSDREALDAGSLGFNELFGWAQASQARSVTIVLDCCKAGSGFTKGSAPDIAGNVDRPESLDDELGKTIKIVSAVPDYQNAPDAVGDTEMSPFTADLYEAVTGGAVADDNGLVALSAVLARLRTVAEERDVAPARVWGGDAGRDPYLAMCADHLSHRLKASGLSEAELVRRGAAMVEGREIRLEADQVDQLVAHFEERYPAVATIGGSVGSGKTWILCDVRDRLRAAGWHTVHLEPSTKDVDADQLLLALKKYAMGLRDREERCLVVIDGVEWSESWSEFVGALDELTRLDDASGFGISVLAAVESAQYDIQRSWRLPSGLALPSIAQSGVAGFIARLMSPEFVPVLAEWDDARLRAAHASLQKAVGTDLWAAVHLAVRWPEPDADQTAIRELWRERIGEITPDRVAALQRLASLGRYNLWCPLDLAAPAGAELLSRLGVEYNRAHDAVRLNSGFLARAILVRQVRDGRPTYVFDRFAADKFARPLLQRHLIELLEDVNRQDELATVIRGLRYHRFVFVPTVAALARSDDSGVSAWERWADLWGDLRPVNEVLAAVRTELPPPIMAHLAGRFFAHVSTHADEELSLWTITASLETMRRLLQGTGSPPTEADEALARLVALAEVKLRTGRWPSDVRRRLFHVFRRLGRFDHTVARELGPSLLRPASPATAADMLLVLDFGRTMGQKTNPEAARAELATWSEVGEDLVRRPEAAGVRTEISHLAARTMLARFIGDETSAERLAGKLKDRMRSARVGELGRTLTLCRRHDRALAGSLVAQLDVDSWSVGLYRGGAAQEVATVLSTLGGLRPDLAVRTLRIGGERIDDGLVRTLAEQLVGSQDVVGASLLLRTAARIEEQRGLLEEGFAQALATTLGRTFLIDSLRNDSRLSVLRYLIEGYAAAQSPVLALAAHDALEVVENDIRNSATERGPRLALILSDDTILGEAFLDSLRARRTILESFMLDRMTDNHEAGALAAHHELGVALYPSIVEQFTDRLAESGTEYSEHRLFKRLATYGNVVNALRAATAVTTTLVLNGERDPGGQVLAAFDRADTLSRTKANWSARVVDSTAPEGLAEALNLLRKLEPSRAARLMEMRSRRLERMLSHAPTSLLAPDLAAVAAISPDAAEKLIEKPGVDSAIKTVLTYLVDEADVFEQVAALTAFTTVENRIHKRIVPSETFGEFGKQWSASCGLISNPRLLAGFIETIGSQGADQASRMAALVSLPRVANRFRRRNSMDVEGAIALVDALSQISANSLPEILSPDEARWLILAAPLRRTASLVESLLVTKTMAPEEAASILAARFGMSARRIRLRDQHASWLSIGWIAWTLRRYGAALVLEEPANSRSLSGVHPQTALWATAWLAPLPWTVSALDDAVKKIRSASPPVTPWAAAAVLTVEAQLERELAAQHGEWAHALDARPIWARALVDAAVPGSRLRETFTSLWPPLHLAKLRAELQWISHGWRRAALQAEQSMEKLIRHAGR